MSESKSENSNDKKSKSKGTSGTPELSPTHLELTQKLHQHFKNDEHFTINHFVKTMTPVIVTGYQGLPILEVAKFMAKSKVCEGPCLTCIQCQAIDKESSIHMKVIRPDGKFIKVDQIREVIEFLSFKREHTTIVIIDQAHLMNLQAANALLKTLEEPPEKCWIVLTSPSIKNVLSTIRSRCLVYKAKPLNLSLLSGVADSDLLQGRWDWFLKSDEILNSIAEVKSWLNTLQNKSELEALDWMKGREGLQELIMYLRLLAKNAMRENSNLSSSSWVTLVSQLQRFEEALSANVDSKLVEEQLFETLRDNYVFH